MTSTHGRNRSGFTLLELLIVLSIVTLLLQLLIPAVQNAREAARRAQCASNVRQFAMAASNYESAHGVLPPAFELKPHAHNFVQYLLPYIEQQAIHESYNFNADWNSDANRSAIENEIPLLHCPTAPHDYPQVSDFAVCLRVQKEFHAQLVEEGLIEERSSTEGALRKGTVRTALITDGMSQTIFFCEDTGRPDQYEYGRFSWPNIISGSHWANPDGRFDLRRRCDGFQMGRGSQLMNCTNNNEIYSFHHEGANFVYGDGSVRFLSEDIDADVFVSQLTSAADD